MWLLTKPGGMWLLTKPGVHTTYNIQGVYRVVYRDNELAKNHCFLRSHLSHFSIKLLLRCRCVYENPLVKIQAIDMHCPS